METKHVLLLIAALAVAAVFWATRPETTSETEAEETVVDPWLLPEVHHLAEHGIRIGPSPEDDIRVSREGDSIRVEISPQYIEKQEAGFLATVGMIKPAESMSPERYAEFLESLHMTVLTDDEKSAHEQQ